MNLDIDTARSRAVLLGVSYFPKDGENLRPLPAVSNNLADLQRALTNPDILGLPPTNITVVDDRAVDEMLTQLVEAGSAAEDTLFVYYAGHGLIDRTELFLAGKNSTASNIRFNGMNFQHFRDAIRESPAMKKIVVLDCCYSGHALYEGMGTAAQVVQHNLDEVEGAYLMTSSGATQISLAPVGDKYTLFTQEFLSVLEKGLPDKQGVLTPLDIYEALSKRLATNLPRIYLTPQAA